MAQVEMRVAMSAATIQRPLIKIVLTVGRTTSPPNGEWQRVWFLDYAGRTRPVPRR